MGRGKGHIGGRGRGGGRGDRSRGPAHSDEDGLDAPGRGAFKSASGSAKFRNDDDSSSGRPTGLSLAVHSKTPKFLQPYAHLLEKGNRKARPARVESDDNDDGQDDQGAADAMMRALEEQPELKLGLEVSQVERMQAEAAKERGNDSFKAKDFPAAIQHYDVAILADNTNAAYYSNRSAAHAALQQWEEARSDGARAANLRPAWSKAWTRLGAALMGLQDYEEAKDAYAKAIELEPDDRTINNAWLKADYEERQASQAGRLAFNKRKIKGMPAAADAAASGGAGQSARGPRGSAAVADGTSGSAGAPAVVGSGRRGAGRGRGRGRRDREAVNATAAPVEPAPKKAKRAILSFVDDSEEDE